MTIIVWILLLAACIGILVVSADIFVGSAEKIGRYFSLSGFIIGVIIIGAGTSLPELASSVIAVLNNASTIVTGNVLGSNITNILLVLGVGALFCHNMTAPKSLFKVDIPLLFSASFLLTILLSRQSFPLFMGGIFLAAAVTYLVYLVTRKYPDELGTQAPEKITMMTLLKVLLSPLFIYYSAEYTVISTVRISEILGINEDIIALSAIALGTSLPEVSVAFSAARKNRADIIMGNIVGSNIFNILIVMGTARMVGELSIPAESLNYSLTIFMGATLLFIGMTALNKIVPWQGIFLLLLYGAFLLGLFCIPSLIPA
ncbi:MAG: calcium/sodium antiporter [Fibrobacterota bacterium]